MAAATSKNKSTPPKEWDRGRLEMARLVFWDGSKGKSKGTPPFEGRGETNDTHTIHTHWFLVGGLSEHHLAIVWANS